MPQKTIRREAVCIGSVKLRDLGNSFGFTVDKEGLEDLGLLTEDGDELVDEEIYVKSVVFDDGTVRYDIPVEDVTELTI